jgi:hypothetical protein
LSQPKPNSSALILYQTEDGRTHLQVRLENQTVWLTQALMGELFQKDVRTINEHLQNIYAEGELTREATIRNFRIVRSEGPRQVEREIEHYNLEAIIAVGYRVKSHRGTQFRIWATQRLREYIVKGFALDDERLKQGGGDSYFDELLQRIREIRLSERNFYRKICDIYQTSMDYDPRAEMTERFFQTVQNKMHWAAHGHTAAEVIHQRTDSGKPNAGLTSWTGIKPRKADAAVAKNYLTEDELRRLGLIVSQYLDFAELQALDRHPMHMRDWIARLDAFLTAGGQRILDHAGNISAEKAKLKAELEFDKFSSARGKTEDARANAEFAAQMDDLAKQAKHLAPPKRKPKKK